MQKRSERIGMVDPMTRHFASSDPTERGTFPELLDGFLSRGVRPDTGLSGAIKAWDNQEFADAVGQISERSVRNWRRGKNLPADLTAIERALFAGHEHYAEWKARLREAYEEARRAGTPTAHLPDPPSRQRPVRAFPPPPARCLGRTADIEELLGLLVSPDRNPHIIILGGPGMGKTTLALAAAGDREVTRKFGSRKWFVALETVTTPDLLEAAVIEAIGLNLGGDRFETALTRLSGAPALLVLDNLETPWELHRVEVETRLALLAATPGLTLLATFRGHDAVLGLRWTREITLEPLAADDARALFLDVAHKIPDNDPNLPELLDVLGGVPLAVSLVALRAAARNRVLELWEEWQRVGVALAIRPGVPPSPVSSLDKSCSISLASCRCDDKGRRLFRLLGQLPAGMARVDRVTLLGDDAFEAESQLLAVGLAFLRGDRLDLLPPVRDFARRHEPPLGPDADLWREHYLSLAREDASKIGFKDGVGIAEQLVFEQANIEAAIEACIAARDVRAAMEALDGFYRLVVTTGRGSSMVISQLAEACREKADLTAEANCMRRIGNMSLWRSDLTSARVALERALELYRQADDPLGEANCVKGLGDMVLERGELITAENSFKLAMDLYRDVQQSRGRADCLLGLAEVRLAREDFPAAQDALSAALAIYREAGVVLGQANCIKGLGDIDLAHEEYAAARTEYEEARELFCKAGNKRGEAECMMRLGDVALKRLDYANARLAYQDALPLFHLARNGRGIGATNARLATIAIGTEREKFLEEAREAWTSIGRLDLVEGLQVPADDAPNASPEVDPELAFT